MMKKLLRSSYFMIMLALACGLKGQDFDQMVDKLIDKSIPLISVEDLSKEQKAGKNLVILDAREKAEYNVSHLKNALWIGYDDFDLDDVNLDPNSEIVVYCSVGYRSEKVAEELEEAGFTHVRNLYGGIFKWVNNGYPIVDREEKETEKVHPYDNSWGQWLIKGQKSYE